MRIAVWAVVLAGGIPLLCGAVLQEWRFREETGALGWDRTTNHVSDVKVEEDALRGRLDDWDPWLTSPQFNMPASRWQAVEIRLKTDCHGLGEIFWTDTTDTPHGGFSPGRETTFAVTGDNQWHTYQILPFWKTEEPIIMIRVDLPQPRPQDKGRKTFALDYVRIVELERPRAPLSQAAWDFSRDAAGWSAEGAAEQSFAAQAWRLRARPDATVTVQSPVTQFQAETLGDWVAVEMAVNRGSTAVLSWASEACEGRCSKTFRIHGDGRFHIYNVEMSGYKGWSGDVMLLSLTPSDEDGAEVALRQIQVTPEPVGPPSIEVRSAGLEDAINRAGQEAVFQVRVFNAGGEPASNLRIEALRLPEGMRVLSDLDTLVFPEVEPLDLGMLEVRVRGGSAIEGTADVVLAGKGAPTEAYRTAVRIDPPLDLPKADYVPEPLPLASDYEVGALYFPGWPTIDRWARIWPVAPERKPVLGWYDEGNPECVDWQIKWAVENGISYFLVDWYWHQGSRHLEHWIKAYKKARYRKHLKWAMMWANHNPKGSHSEEDQRAVTQYWIDEYFGMPEYYTINGKPVVMIWSPAAMNRDMQGKGGVARLLQISRNMARQAGYPGIWFVAMKWPEASTEAKDIQWLADAGFDMTSIYHYMHHGGDAQNPRRYPFDMVAESSYPFWQARHETGILPFLPNLSTGWDSRPWHGDRALVIHGRTVPLFRQICEDAKRFADETGVKRLVLAPVNEWGEGSYAEPCKEFGFGMYECVREVFCEKPAGGWPLNYGPEDVGLGPYDLARETSLNRDSWDFSGGAQGWGAMMGIDSFEARDGALHLVCAHNDPALKVVVDRLRAKKYRAVRIRLKVLPMTEDPGSLQLFWSTVNQPITEATSVRAPLTADGEFHDVVLPVAENRRWRGRITGLRLDTGSTRGASMIIDRVTMVGQDSE